MGDEDEEGVTHLRGAYKDMAHVPPTVPGRKKAFGAAGAKRWELGTSMMKRE